MRSSIGVLSGMLGVYGSTDFGDDGLGVEDWGLGFRS